MVLLLQIGESREEEECVTFYSGCGKSRINNTSGLVVASVWVAREDPKRTLKQFSLKMAMQPSSTVRSG